MDRNETRGNDGQGRLILVSNRLPVRLTEEGDGWSLERTTGGLATGLAGPHRSSGGIWIGWPGTALDGHSIPDEARRLLRHEGFRGLGLDQEEFDRFYLRASNRCIWPLLHSFVERVEFDRDDWAAYRSVNERYAEMVAESARPGDVVFVQDYQLMLVPAMVRERCPDVRIGFFLHVPFPPTGIFRALPARAEIIRGLLGADVIGFHTLEYVRSFRAAARRVLGLETTSQAVQYEGRQVTLMAQPLGIDTVPWQRPGDDPEMAAATAEYLEAAKGRKVLLGVERLDYTKGIPERLQAFHELLREEPELVDEVVFFQIAVPSRVDVDAYRELKEETERLAGEINARFGRVGHQPLHYQFHGVDRARLTALYRIADVCVVTPLRDGLNLVAKEFVAAREDDDGVLVLSEFTGAAWELSEAIHVNPYDIEGMKNALKRALSMPVEEQAALMAPMRERVRRDDVHQWTRAMLGAIRGSVRPPAPVALVEEAQQTLDARWNAARDRLLALDYDGTLRELVDDPASAVPDQDLLDLLEGLDAIDGVEVWVVSGRDAGFLAEHLDGTGIGLIAEHGLCARGHGEEEFKPLLPGPPSGWKHCIRMLLETVTGRVRGSHIEEKPNGIAWHYRAADAESAAWQAHELYQYLGEILANEPLEVLRGSKVIEVRPSGVSKSRALAHVLQGRSNAPDLMVVAGDDITDESMFRGFPDAMSILVGARPSAAHHSVNSPAEFRALLARWSWLAGTAAVGGTTG